MDLKTFHRRSIDDREAFWAEQAGLIHWHKPFERVLDYSNPPFARWFVDGQTNLCFNAIDRHLATQADAPALIFVSTETGEERSYTFAELHAEVMRMAAIFRELGVKRGDRVLIYLPMIPEAAFAMYACARIGAVHSVVFGGFASHSLASRIDDAEPKLVVSADAGSRNGKVVAATLVEPADEIMMITTGGVLIRTRVSEIREMGRATQGVTLIAVEDGAKLSGLQRIMEADAEDEPGADEADAS